MLQSPIYYKYKLSQKSPVYAKHIQLLLDLKVKVLEKRIVGLWQTDIHANNFLFAHAQSHRDTGQTGSPPELPGWSKVTTTYFLCVDQFGLF